MDLGLVLGLDLGLEPGPGPSRVGGQDAGGLDLGMVLGLVLVLGLGPGPGLVGFVSGSWLELSGVVVAIGCFVYECFRTWLNIYAAVMLSDRFGCWESVC